MGNYDTHSIYYCILWGSQMGYIIEDSPNLKIMFHTVIYCEN